MSRKTFLVQHYEVKRARRMTIGGGAAVFASQILCHSGDGTRFVLFFMDPSRDAPDNIYNPDARWATSYLPAEQFDWYQDLLRNEKPVYAYLNSASPRVNGLFTVEERIGETEEAPDLEDWLTAHPQVREALVWEAADGPQSYGSWSNARKTDLAGAYEAAWFAAPDELPDPLPNQATTTDEDLAVQVLSAADAWKLYLAYVAHSLASEISGALAWSVTGYSAANLALLFDSREFFLRSAARSGYQIQSSLGVVLPAPPRYTHDFIVFEDLQAHNRYQTIGRILDWCRDNLVHYSGARRTGNLERQWQYRGFPPVSRIIDGTPNSDHPEWGMAHRTAGCHGTLGFLRAVLRCLNIPVRPNHACGHALPHFPTEDRYLSHGDDPYNRFSKGTPDPFPGTSLMITGDTYDAWFGPGVTHDKKCDNVGRNVRELALIHLPPYLLQKHCDDLAAGRSHAESGVAESFEREYSVAELEAMDLWDRIEAKIDGYGGCEHIP